MQLTYVVDPIFRKDLFRLWFGKYGTATAFSLNMYLRLVLSQSPVDKNRSKKTIIRNELIIRSHLVLTILFVPQNGEIVSKIRLTSFILAKQVTLPRQFQAQ